MAKFTTVTGAQIRKSLVHKLQPTADSLRDLLTRFGLRSYLVRVVRVRWTGEVRGEGVSEVVSELMLLPTPKIGDLTTITETVQSIGVDELGGIEVSGISGRYTEEQLRGLDADGSDCPPTDEVFWEIEFPRVDGQPSLKRRFIMRGAPSYKAGGLQWVVKLEKSGADRDRTGDTEG